MSAPFSDLTPTLLVFTLGASREARRRSLLPGVHRSLERRLHRACLDRVLDAGRAAGCRLLVSTPEAFALPHDARRIAQDGRNFGERLEQAFAQALEISGGPVLLVGSDIPDLQAHHLEQALDQLRDDPDRVVIGPSPDGGLYLLAAARPIGASLLMQTVWRSRTTLRSLRRVLQRAAREVVLLAPLADLDRRSDLLSWLAACSACGWSGIAALLRKALEPRRQQFFEASLPIRPGLILLPLLRGPPHLAVSLR